VTAIPSRRRLAGLALALPVLGFATLGTAVTLGSAPAFAADRGVILFQPVTTDTSGAFIGIGAGPFTTAYPDGVKDDGKTLARNKVVADNFTKTYEWGSDGSTGGMVIKNLSRMPICQITINSLDGSTFPKDVKLYKAPANWQVTVSDDAKTLTFAAVGKDNCVSKDGGWFWMQVPESPKPTEGKPTLSGKLALADGGSDATAQTSIDPDTVATGTAVDTTTATDSATPTEISTDTSTPTDSASDTSTPTDSATASDAAPSSGPPTSDPSTTADQPTPSDSATSGPPLVTSSAPQAGAGF
jgi:hypothetical protein